MTLLALVEMTVPSRLGILAPRSAAMPS